MLTTEEPLPIVQISMGDGSIMDLLENLKSRFGNFESCSISFMM